MAIRNKAFSKVAALSNKVAEVELSKETVELGLVDELKALSSSADGELKNHEKFVEEFETVKRRGRVNSKQAVSTQKVIAKNLDSFNSKAKELGVDPRSIKEYKELSQKFSDLSVIISEYNTKFK